MEKPNFWRFKKNWMKNAKSALILSSPKERFSAYSTHAIMFSVSSASKAGEHHRTLNSVKSTAERARSVGKDLKE